MATTQDFGVTKDTRIARRESDNWDAGSGTSPGLPYGLYSGYRYRALLGFSINFAGWTSIVSATFNYKTSNQINVAFGSDPTMLIQRLSAAWSEGSQSALSASNSTIYPGPGAYATNGVQEDAPTGENAWGAADITAMMRDAMAAGVFHGIRILGSTNSSVESDSASNVGEIYSREGGSDAYIRIVYETNRPPNVPTVSSPDVSGGVTPSQTPTLNVNMTDPDGNAINNYNWQVDDNADFSSPIQDVYGGVAGASGVTVGVVPAALARGGTYYFRVRAADVSVWGDWSTTFQFKVASFPTLTLSEPSASGRLARIQYDAGSGWVSPRMVVNWGMTCPDGGTQSSWRVEVFNDSAGALGSLFNDSNTVGDTQSARVIPANLIEGNYYHVRVTATCSHGLTTVTGPYRVRARWGVVTHRFDMTTPPGSLALTTLDATDGTQGKVVVEYMTTTGAAPTTWASSIGGAGLNQFFYYRAWLLIWGTSPAVSPTLNQLKITYSTATITPDKWSFQNAANASGDAGAFVFGTQSLRMKGTGSTHSAYQSIPVVPNTNYILSARIQTQGNPIAQVTFSTGPTGGGVGITTPIQAADIPFEDPRSRLASGIWNSGSNTSIYIRCVVAGAVGTTAHFDAIKVEASTVVTPWSPGYIADAVVLDAGGMQIDGSSGGIFRLKGSGGTARDIVELGAKGLRFGGEVDLYSPSAALLETNGHFRSAGYVAAAGAVVAGSNISAGGGIVGPYVMGSGGAGGVLKQGGDASSASKWVKVASGTIAGQYWSQHLHGYLIARYGVSELSYILHADAGAASQPSVTGHIRVLEDNSGQAVKAATLVVRSVNPIVYEVWVQTVGGYAFIDWFPDVIDGEGAIPVIENPATLGWQAALPGGTQYPFIYIPALTGPIARYVPVTPHQSISLATASSTSSVGQTHSQPISGIPSSAIAVSVISAVQFSVVHAGARFRLYGYDAGLAASKMKSEQAPGKVAAHYEESSVFYIELGGDRQFDYSSTNPVAGTMGWVLYCTGYWTY